MSLTPVERISAESEIRNLVARIAHLADDGDLDEYLSYFTDEARWRVGGEPFRQGKADLLAGALERRADGIQGPGSGTRHVVTTMWVEITNASEAQSQAYFILIATHDSEPGTIPVTGRYSDRFVNTADGWKLLERQIDIALN